MQLPIVAALSAATCVATLALSGCSQGTDTTPTASSTAESTTTSVAPAPAPVPDPAALTDVLYRLADPAVPGADKLDLVEGAKADDVATLDKFPKALLDGGFMPMTFEASDVAWADQAHGDARPDVLATVNITPNPEAGSPFSFPMVFKEHNGGWQLSQSTADMLFGIGGEPSGTAPTPPR